MRPRRPRSALSRGLPSPVSGSHPTSSSSRSVGTCGSACRIATSRNCLKVDHVTVYRWVVRFTSLLADAARPCRHRAGDGWLVDETYVRVAGRWRYIYRAIDQFGQIIDVYVSPRRDARAARRFFEQAIGATKVKPAKW